MVDAFGKNSVELSGVIKDASVIKEKLVMETLQKRDNQIAQTHENSGIKLKFEMQEVMPGIYVQVLSEFQSREQAEFHTPLPQKPSIHPVWETVRSVTGTVAKYGLIGFGISELSNVWQSGLDAATQNWGSNNDFSTVNTTTSTNTTSTEAPVSSTDNSVTRTTSNSTEIVPSE